MHESQRFCAHFRTKNEGEPDRVRPRMAATMTLAADRCRSRGRCSLLCPAECAAIARDAG